jgi:hypothetical protein
MGGYNSGRRWDSKATTSDYCHLDVRCWQRSGHLVVGRSFAWQAWEVDVVTSLKRDEPNLVRLYRYGQGRRSEPYRVCIEWTPCNYGGSRAWFVCPRSCGRRVAILYGDGSLACRHCNQLAYQSQHESPRYRGLHRARAIRRELGGSISLAEPFPPKPTGMHWLTYVRFRAEDTEATARFRLSILKQIAGSGAKISLRPTTVDVVDRLLELADLPPEHTGGNIMAQVNALRAIAEIKGYL